MKKEDIKKLGVTSFYEYVNSLDDKDEIGKCLEVAERDHCYEMSIEGKSEDLAMMFAKKGLQYAEPSLCNIVKELGASSAIREMYSVKLAELRGSTQV